MAFRCPHCGDRGITVLARLLTAATFWYALPARCRLCGESARLAGRFVRIQFVTFVACLATIPALLSGDAQITAAYVAAGAIVALGMLGPLEPKRL